MNAVAEEQPAVAYVYVIGADDGPQKVGFSSNPAIRCYSLGGGRYRVHHAHEVYAGEARVVERFAHCLLYEHHAKGEWFNVSPADARAALYKAVKAVRSGEQPPFVPMLFNRKKEVTRSNALGLRITPELKDALLAEAASQKRSLANYIEWEMERLMREKGRMK